MKRTLVSYICSFLWIPFIIGTVLPPAYALEAIMPAPGVMVEPSRPWSPCVLKGLKYFPEDPFRYDLILDSGDSGLSGPSLKDESTKLIEYFLASLTTPSIDLWVNLSPYEQERIIPDGFGLTEMGRALLAQDYLLKQLTATLLYPKKALGKKFWDEVYAEAQARFGTTEVPVDTFHKVWVVPEQADIVVRGSTVVIAKARLKVMLESDYLAERAAVSRKPLAADEGGNGIEPTESQAKDISTQIMREVIVPAIEREVNTGENFAPLRQVYHSLILATWLKRKVMADAGRQAAGSPVNPLLSVYIDHNKTAGVDHGEAGMAGRIWHNYVEAFKKGVFNYIQDEPGGPDAEPLPRKYFSGGYDFAMVEKTMREVNVAEIRDSGRDSIVSMRAAPVDAAMIDDPDRMPDSGKRWLPAGLVNRPNWTVEFTETDAQFGMTLRVRDLVNRIRDVLQAPKIGPEELQRLRALHGEIRGLYIDAPAGSFDRSLVTTIQHGYLEAIDGGVGGNAIGNQWDIYSPLGLMESMAGSPETLAIVAPEILKRIDSRVLPFLDRLLKARKAVIHQEKGFTGVTFVDPRGDYAMNIAEILPSLPQELWFDPGPGNLNISWDQLRWRVTPFPRGMSGLAFRVDDNKTKTTFVLRTSAGQEDLGKTRQALVELGGSQITPQFLGETEINGRKFLAVEFVNGPNLSTLLESPELPEAVGRELGKLLLRLTSKGRVMGDANNFGNFVWDESLKEVRIVDAEWIENWGLAPETAREYLKVYIHDYWQESAMPQILEWNDLKRKNLGLIREAALAELDKAMLPDTKKADVGGIDLNDNRLQLNVTDNGNAPSPIFQTDGLAVTGNILGLRPVILDIKPATSLRAILGLVDQSGQERS